MRTQMLAVRALDGESRRLSQKLAVLSIMSELLQKNEVLL